MKKLFSLSLIPAILLLMTVTTETAEAQVQDGDFSIGLGLAYGSGVGFGGLDNDLGLRADAYYAVSPDIRVGGDFIFYLPKSEGGVDVTVWELNGNGHYMFVNQEELLIYGLAGLNITGLSVSANGSSSDTELGLNLGAGLEYDLDFASFFGEFKLGGLAGNADQLVLGAGLRFGL